MVEEATGVYREVPVPPALRQHFVCAWTHRMPSVEAPPLVIIPDAHVDLIWMDGVLRVAGPDRQFHREAPPPAATLVGFRLRSGHAAAWLGVPMVEIVDQRLPLADLCGARRLADALGDSRDPVVVMRRLGDALARRSDRIVAPAPEISAAFAMLSADARPTGAPVRWLATELNLSERTLRRQFDEAFGYGPKTLDRILRFQRYVNLIQHEGHWPIARLAAAAGYADQAHLTRECQRMAAATPTELKRRFAVNAG